MDHKPLSRTSHTDGDPHYFRARPLSRAIHTCVYSTGRTPHYFDSFSLSPINGRKKKGETRTSMGTPSGIGPRVVASTLVYAVRIARRHSAFGDRPFVCWFTRPSVCSSATPFPQLGSRSSEARKRDGTLASICYLEPRGCNPSFLIFPHLLFLREPRENPRLSPTKRAPLSSTPPLPSWRLVLFFVCFGTIKNETRRYARIKNKRENLKKKRSFQRRHWFLVVLCSPPHVASCLSRLFVR